MIFNTFAVIIIANTIWLIKTETVPLSDVDCGAKCPVNITIVNGQVSFKYGHGVCDCPSDWTRGPDNECLFYMGSTPITYEDALRECADKYNAKLLTIKNAVKQQFVEDFLKSKAIDANLWLNAVRLRKPNDDTSFIWLDGTKFISYSHWTKTDPGNSDENCVNVFAGSWSDVGYEWGDFPCEIHSSSKYSINAICERPCS